MMNTITYIVDAFLLNQAADFLQPVEKVCFVTGVRLFGGKVIILTQLVPVKFTGSRAGAEPDPVSVFKQQQKLKGLGLAIEAQFHSHPLNSVAGTRPSTTDDNTARRWETGAPFIGAIFSEGGRYVRFFNHRQSSVVHVHGATREIEPCIFELPPVGTERFVHAEDNAMPPEAGESERSLGPDGPATEDCVVQPEESVDKSRAGRRMWWPWKQRASDSRQDGIHFNRLL